MPEETSPSPSPLPDSDSAPPSPSDSPETPARPSGPFLSWPPPGLEQIQGKLAGTTAFLFLGASVLVLPLLLSIGTRQTFTSLGVFGPAGWIVALTTAGGLVLLVEGFRRLFGIVRTGNRAIQQGHGWLTVLQAAADGPRDTGFLLQGARLYAGVNATVRELLLRRRLFASAATLAAALWILLGFVLGVFLAARGILGPTGLWWFLFLPLCLLLLVAALERIGAGLQTRALRRHTREEVTRNLAGEIDAWRSQAGAFDLPGILGSGGPGRLKSLRVITAVTAIVGLVFLIPIVTFTFMGTLIPLQLGVTIPRFQGVQEKATLVEHLRPYRLPRDESISPSRAGGALVNLNSVGSDKDIDPLLVAPARHYPQAWQFTRDRNARIRPEDLFGQSLSDLSRELQTALRVEAANPAHEEFALLAAAPTADFVSTYWHQPFPDTLSWSSLSIPRLHTFIDGVNSHLCKAAWEYHMGQRTRAEQSIREVISSGFLLLDEHPSLIGNLIGIVTIERGARALEAYFQAVGRTVETQRLVTAREEIERTLAHITPRTASSSPTERLATMADIVMDRHMMRGMRWEFIPAVTTGASFTNLNRAVFGPGEEFDVWLQTAHDELVRNPGEEALFEVMKMGYLLSPRDLERRGFLEWLLGLTFGKSGTPGSFAALLRAMN